MRLMLTGILLTTISWAIAWSKIPFYSEHTFFPLWFGYVLAVNGLSEWLFRDSLIRRMNLSFLLLFIFSLPFWWFFEFINLTVKNWHYVFPHPISQSQFAIQASIDFSTVIPAVLSTSFFVYRFALKAHRELHFSALTIRKQFLSGSVFLGVSALCLLALIPDMAFPLVWIAPILIVEPFNFALGYPSLLGEIKKGDWTLPASIMVSTFFIGVLWELWNFYSLPKWIYTIPHVGFWKIFEMPLLGFLGYPFFGIIAYSFTVFMFSVAFRNKAAEIPTFFSPRH